MAQTDDPKVIISLKNEKQEVTELGRVARSELQAEDFLRLTRFLEHKAPTPPKEA